MPVFTVVWAAQAAPTTLFPSVTWTNEDSGDSNTVRMYEAFARNEVILTEGEHVYTLALPDGMYTVSAMTQPTHTGNVPEYSRPNCTEAMIRFQSAALAPSRMSVSIFTGQETTWTILRHWPLSLASMRRLDNVVHKSTNMGPTRTENGFGCPFGCIDQIRAQTNRPVRQMVRFGARLPDTSFEVELNAWGW
jgi:hypothetical protein